MMKNYARFIVTFFTLLCFVGVVAYAATNDGWVAWDGISRQAPPSVDVRTASPTGIDLYYQSPGMFQSAVSTPGGGFTYLSVVDGGICGDVGHPELPAIRKMVSIPYGATPSLMVLNMNVATYSFEDLGIGSPIYPVQAPIEKLPGALENAPFYFDEAVYATDAYQHDVLVEMGEIGIIRGHRYVEVIVYPVDVNPATQEVKALVSLEVRITLTGSDMELTRAKQARYNSFPFETLTDRLLIKTSMDQQTRDLNGMPEPPLLLIITDPQWETNTDLLDYVDWKFDKGFRTEFKTTNTTGASATEIKAYIQNAYDNWPVAPTFILLIGDIGSIPTWRGSGTGDPKTDLNYTMLEGTDYKADADLGRWSVVNLTDLTNIITKTMEYEQVGWTGNDTWEKWAVFLASADNYTVSEGTHNFVIDNFLTPDGYTSDKLYCHTYSAITQEVRDAHNAGRSLSIFSGHGWYDEWSDGPRFSQSDVNNLYNTVYPFVQSYSCLTGAFASTSYPECFSETWIRANHAGIGIMASSVSSYWTEDDILEKRVMEGFCANVNPGDENQTWTAGMMNYGKLRFFAHFGDNSTTRCYFEMYNIMGDPSIDLWTAVPVAIGVTHDATLFVGATSFDVTVSSISDWALVCVHDENGEIYSTQYLFTDGTATMDLGAGATTSGTLHITVTGHDCDPYQSSVPIMDPVTDLTAIRSGDDVILDWTPTDADEYHIYISDDPEDFSGVYPIVVTSPPYTVTGDAANYDKNFYQVISVKN